MDKWIYDIETYRNFFCCTCLDLNSDEKVVFIIDEQTNDYEKLKQFFKNRCFIGYNNLMFDNVVINYIISERMNDATKIADFANSIIVNKDNYDIIKYYKYNNNYKSVDLMTHLFSKALRVGLKELEVSMNYENVQELPIHFTKHLTESEKQEVLDYNLNDCKATKLLCQKCKASLELRTAIKKEFGLECYSKDGVRTGVDLLLKLYCESTGENEKDVKELRTYRPIINFTNIISSKIQFKSKEFTNLLHTLKNTSISTTKGALDFKVLYGGVLFVFGTGGLHSKDKPELIVPKEDEILLDCDVASLYPSILINYGFKPAHLSSEFLEVYKHVKNDRIVAKNAGNKLKSETYKLSLNGLYGNLINSYSWAYDPQAAMGITINGQLFLTMLAERFIDNGIKVSSINTDGITCLLKRDQQDLYYKICKDWEKLTQLELEYVEYSKIFRRNVNTYFAQLSNGKVKEKGEFLCEPVLGKGYSAFIIPIALKEHFINNTPIEDTIRNHKNIYNFCMMQKVDKKFQVKWNGQKQQRINRYYVTNDGAYLYKVDGNKTINLLAGYSVQIFNKFEAKKNFDEYNLNYAYYISEANKILEEIVPTQMTLF